ncbi:DUF7336 domain-containing protein [Lactiplantibacillus plantarum]
MYVLYYQYYDEVQIYGVFASRDDAEKRILDWDGKLYPDGGFHVEHAEVE